MAPPEPSLGARFETRLIPHDLREEEALHVTLDALSDLTVVANKVCFHSKVHQPGMTSYESSVRRPPTLSQDQFLLTLRPVGNPGANDWFLQSTPVQTPLQRGGICGRFT